MEDKKYYRNRPVELNTLVGHSPLAEANVNKIISDAQRTMGMLSCPITSWTESSQTKVTRYYWTRKSQAKLYRGLGQEYGWEQKIYDAPDDATIAYCREAVRQDHFRRGVIVINSDADLQDVMQNRHRNVWPSLTNPENIGNLLDTMVRFVTREHDLQGLRFAGQADCRTYPPATIRGLGPDTKRIRYGVRQFHECLTFEIDCDVPWRIDFNYNEGIERIIRTHVKYGEGSTARLGFAFFRYEGHEKDDERAELDAQKDHHVREMIKTYCPDHAKKMGEKERVPAIRAIMEKVHKKECLVLGLAKQSITGKNRNTEHFKGKTYDPMGLLTHA